MADRYKILYQGAQQELVEKKSRFIATAKPVKTEAEAVAFIDEMKKKYWDASHNCSAYVIGERSQIMRCSDDGEPSQTAGRPMLDVLLGAEIKDICVVVTRYFGGTLLGTGGLVRAYSGAVHKVLESCQITDQITGRKLSVMTDYNGIGKLQYLFNKNSSLVLDTRYTDQVEVILLIPLYELEEMKKIITEETHGKARMEELEQITYGLVDQKVVFL